MPFLWDIKQYLTLLDYKAALMPFAVPSWIKGITLHHTYKPTQADWQGERTMEALKRYYSRTLKWPAGPHLFLAPDGIWAGTPLAFPGVHAGVCNSSRIGLEVVGRFDDHPYDVGLRERIYALLVLLLQWLGATETAIKGHRECLPNKSCPGRAIAMGLVRNDVRERLFDRRFVVSASTANVRLYPRTNSLRLDKAGPGESLNAHPVRGELHAGSDRWARVRLPNGKIGHIWAGLGRWEMV